MNEKTPLGEKSIKYIVIQLVLFIICLFALILCIIILIETEEKSSIIFIVLFSLLVLLVGYSVINVMIKPKIIVEEDESGIYLNYTKNKTIYILVRNIESISDNKARSRYKTYSFGTLIIKTKEKKYKIGIINDVAKVRKHIYSRIAYKY